MHFPWKPARWVASLNRKWAVAVGLVVFFGLCGVTAWALKRESHLIVISGLDQALSFRTTEQDLGTALKTQGIRLGAMDQVEPALSTSLKGKPEVIVSVRKAVPVTVVLEGNTLTAESVARTVGDLLKEMEITLGAKDIVSVDPGTELAAGMNIKITRRTERVTVEREEIPYDTIRDEDRTMNQGETRVVQDGESGIKEIKRVTYLEDGKEVSTEVMEEVVVKVPVDRVVAYGTVAVVSRGGRQYRYTSEFVMSSTGYTAGKESNPNGNGYTYTGMKAERGVVAVDPNVIPLYTRLYIEGYGPAIAADIGGAIKGNKIDLCFDTVAEALEWGRRPAKVYILGD